MRQLVIYCARGSARRKGYEFGGSHRIPKGGSSVRCRGISQREYHCDTTGAGSRTRRELPTCAREMWSEHWTPPAQSATASPLGQRQPIKSQQQPPGSNALAADTCAPLDPLLALSSSLLLPHSLRGTLSETRSGCQAAPKASSLVCRAAHSYAELHQSRALGSATCMRLGIIPWLTY